MSSKKTILLVDDEESILFSLQRILELSGEYEIITAVDGKQALQKMETYLPDLILSDIIMPEMDGIELCKKVRSNELFKNLPFIFLTAKKELMIEGIKVGGDDFIIKPFTFDEVIVKIEAIFRRVKNTREQASQFKGNLSDYNLDKILQICYEKTINGELILQNDGQVAKINLDRGEITRARFKGLSDDQALDVLRTWDTGIFVIRPFGMELKPEIMFTKANEDLSKRLDEPIELAKDTWWVGYRNPDTLLQVNVYLRQFRSHEKVINYLIDPGSPVDFPIVSKKIAKVIGNIAKVHLYTLNHQDPDVCMNSVFIRNANPGAICLTTEENWRLISHYEINPKSVKLINNFKDWKVTLSSGHRIIFLPSPFCHARGSFLTYDLETRILYTGDLFGGISEAERIKRLYAEEEDWDGIRAFHQIYMPTNQALRYAIDSIMELKHPPLMIAPQHGNILRGELMKQFIDRIYNLDVGLELLEQIDSAEFVNTYVDACNELLEHTVSFIPYDTIIRKIRGNSQVIPLVEFRNGKVLKIFSRPKQVFDWITMTLIEGEDARIINQVKSFALKLTHTKGLPAPLLEWDITSTRIPAQLFKSDEESL